MQCHNCPHNGHPTETCLTCKAAEYLDNKFTTVNPVPDTSVLKDKIPVVHSTDNDRGMADCIDILRALETCTPSSFKKALALFILFASLDERTVKTLIDVLNGETLTSCAKGEGTTKQAVHQRWLRISKLFPELSQVPKRNRKRSPRWTQKDTMPTGMK